MHSPKMRLAAICGLVISCLLSSSDGLAVMSVDLGSGWMKIAIVSPGVPMEIALNKESKRKTPVALSFRDGDREIGDDALNLGVRFPEWTYTYILDLVGKTIDNPMVQLYQHRFPHHKLDSDAERGCIVFLRNGEHHFTPEELLSMVLHRARESAQTFAEQPIKDAVIIVPAFFNQAERRSVLRAANLADIKVLQLINDNSAVALNYGIFRRKDFNSTAQNIMFYDMGASSTMATIVAYQTVKTKERGFTETNPQLSILGVGYDRTLGGLEFTLRLRDHLAKAFNAQKKTANDVFSSPRAMSKLMKEAERVKMVLSANADHMAQVEGLLDDKDFRAPVTRAEFEDLWQDLMERVGRPVQDALKRAAMSLDDIDQVILVGAGTRVPKVQEKLLQEVGKSELGKNLNTDEAAAMGAVYQAAHLSKGFKVKKFNIKDAVIFPIQVDFERELDVETGKSVKVVSRTLFSPLNPYPQKKVMTFNRHVKDFTFSVNYGDLSFLRPEEVRSFGSVNISRVSLVGVSDALNKHSSDGSESKGVKAHFRMDESGLLSLDLVESVFETKEEAPMESDTESAFSKLGSTISKLFSGATDEDLDKAKKTDDKPLETKAEEEDAAGGEKSNSEQDVPTVDKVSATTDEPLNKTAANKTQVNATAGATSMPDESTAQNTTEKKPPRIVWLKEPIELSQELLDLAEQTTEQTLASKLRLKEFNEREKAKQEFEEAKNNLEAFTLDTQDKLTQFEFEAASTETMRDSIRIELLKVSDWLYEADDDVDTKTYRGKLQELKVITKDLFERVKEHRDRPEALAALSQMINVSETFLRQAHNLSDDDQYFTSVELDVLQKMINDTQEWKREKVKEQSATPLWEKPKLTVHNIVEKIALMDREVKYLVNKARTAKPKAKKTSDDTSENRTSSNATKDSKAGETVNEEVDDVTIEEPESELPEPETESPEENAELEDDSSASEKMEDKPSRTKPTDDHVEL